MISTGGRGAGRSSQFRSDMRDGPGRDRWWLRLVIANGFIPLALFVFALGFFPYKPFLPGRASFSPFERQEAAAAPFDKVVFMVVDALRSDFVFSSDSSFHFVQSLIRDGAAMPFTSHAASPTITMPRVKALTTGSVPSFVDVVLNFAESETDSSLAHQDSWLRQLKDQANGKLLMFGDDTWLHLFPGFFERADGTSSFFVSDFTEVDNNVTRNVPGQILQADWSGMILHYLGLDHIGHKSGPQSPHMRPKQDEMDSIVRMIYHEIEAQSHLQSTLLVLCGDHGMNEAGNHGGSSPGETSPALVFISPKLRSITPSKKSPAEPSDHPFLFYDLVEQSDIAPTLAGLLGFPIPLNNLGVFIRDMLAFWPEDAALRLIMQNAQQIFAIVRNAFPKPRHYELGFDCAILQAGDRLWCSWHEAELAFNSNQSSYSDRIESIYSFTNLAQKTLSSAASNYDVPRLLLAVVLMLGSLLSSWPKVWSFAKETPKLSICALTVCMTNGIVMFGSSYVEEEHLYWYWVTSAWFCLVAILQRRAPHMDVSQQMYGVLAIISFRFVRSWNQTGQKHAGEPDIVDSFLRPHNMILWALVLLTYCSVVWRMARSGPLSLSSLTYGILSLYVAFLSLKFKIAFTALDGPELLSDLKVLHTLSSDSGTLVAQAQWVFMLLGLLLLVGLGDRCARRDDRLHPDGLWKTIHPLLTLFLMTQARITNVPLFLLIGIQGDWIQALNPSASELVLTTIMVQYSTFFAFGGSNAISSVDLSNAYNGVSEYNIVGVGLLTFVSNWAGPIWWVSRSFLMPGSHGNRIRSQAQSLEVFSFISTFILSVSTIAVMLACIALRAHLFVWTVFSPKFLFTAAWALGNHIGINIVFVNLIEITGRCLQ